MPQHYRDCAPCWNFQHNLGSEWRESFGAKLHTFGASSAASGTGIEWPEPHIMSVHAPNSRAIGSGDNPGDGSLKRETSPATLGKVGGEVLRNRLGLSFESLQTTVASQHR